MDGAAVQEFDISDVAERAAPPSFMCPISHELMRNPVSCADGHSYERANIEFWLRRHGTSPKTGAQLAHREVTANHALRNSIEEFLERTFKIAARGDIELGRQVGAGSFKTVHEGKLRGRPVAILKLRAGAPIDAEVKTFIKLGRHPSLVQFLGLCIEGPSQLIVTEFASFGSLDNFLAEREGQLGLAHKLVMAAQILSLIHI